MTKKSKDADNRLSLLDLLQQSQGLQKEEITEGSLNIHTSLCHAMTRAIKDSGQSRWQIAGRMSHLLGVEISKYMLDAWTSQSKEGHRIPAGYIPAFCASTGSHEPLRILTDAAGLYCLPGPDALRAEIQRCSEEEERMRAERRKHELFLERFEGH